MKELKVYEEQQAWSM